MSESTMGERWLLRLYIAGMTPTARRALANLEKICQEHLAQRHTVEVVDLLERPELAEGEQIFATPTLVRQLPLPLRKVIGDLSNTERVVSGLGLPPRN